MDRRKVGKMTFAKRDDWLRERALHITATAFGAVLNVNPWESPIDVVMRMKYGENRRVPENEAMIRGNTYESVVNSLFEAHFKGRFRLKRPPKGNWLFFRKDKPWIACTPDAMVIDLENRKRTILNECKYHLVRGNADSDKWESGNIPYQYYAQVLAQMIATLADEAFLSVLLEFERPNREGAWAFDHQEFRYYRFVREELKDELDYIEKTVDTFYRDCIIGNKMPDVVVNL